MNQQKVLIVDDHEIVRYGLKHLINNDKSFIVCGEAKNETEAITSIENLNPDILIIDISLDGNDGIELIKKVRSTDKEILILCFSMHDEKLFAERALRVGANGYIMKESGGTKEILTALNKISNNEIFISRKMMSHLLRKKVLGEKSLSESVLNQLSDREYNVFSLIGKGLTSIEISEKLFISAKTIETYKERIKKKLDIKNSFELVQYAVKWHLNQDKKNDFTI